VPETGNEIHFRVLRVLQHNPQITQRELAEQLGVSLGKINYCLQALIDKGLVKVTNFKNSKRKRAYLYLLTPKGIEAKTKISIKFLRRKMREFESLKEEISHLESEIEFEKNLKVELYRKSN
jgi:EPS-associated MarR family transcriptional regulator